VWDGVTVLGVAGRSVKTQMVQLVPTHQLGSVDIVRSTSGQRCWLEHDQMLLTKYHQDLCRRTVGGARRKGLGPHRFVASAVTIVTSVLLMPP
jgi:hypothetical protein